MKTVLMIAVMICGAQHVQEQPKQSTHQDTTVGSLMIFSAPSNSKVIMECDSMSPDGQTAHGCKLQNGGTLDDVVNQLVASLRQSQSDHQKTSARFDEYIRTVQRTLTAINRPSPKHRHTIKPRNTNTI